MLTRLKETKRQVVGAILFAMIGISIVEWIIGTAIVWTPRTSQIESFDTIWAEMKHPIEIFRSALNESPFVSFQFIVPILFILFTVKIYGVLVGKGKYRTDASYGAYGTATLATPSEVFNDREFVKKTWRKSPNENLMNRSGLIFGLMNNRPVILHEETDIPNRNVFIIGSPGSGKTQSYILTNIIHETERSIVVTDPKAEILEKTARLKMEQGYDVKVINFKEMTVSDRYNPIDYIDKEIEAERVATTIVMNAQVSNQKNPDFWARAEVALLKTLLLYVKKECPENATMAKVKEILTEQGRTPEEMDEFFDRLERDHPAYQAYLIVRMADDKVRASIFISLGITLSKFDPADVRKFMETSDFKLDDIGRKKMIVYCVLPVADPTWEPLISTFFTQMFQRLYDVADHNFSKLPVKVNLMLDEFPNLGTIPGYEEILATCRGYGISSSTIVQSIGQLISKYSKEKADAIIGNCSLRYLLGVGDKLTAEYFSHLIGKTTVETRSSSSSKNSRGGSDSTSLNYSARSLYTPDELTRLNKKEGILLVVGMNVIKLNKVFQFEFFKGILSEGTEISRFDFLRERDGLPEPRMTLEDMIDFGETVEPLSFMDQLKHDMNQMDEMIEGTGEQIEEVVPAIHELVSGLSVAVSNLDGVEDEAVKEESEMDEEINSEEVDQQLDELHGDIEVAHQNVEEEAVEMDLFDSIEDEDMDLELDSLLEDVEDEEKTKVNT
ncbi:Type IV secretory system Conjugative DNA transfer [Thermoactinomyces sp. DSM 45891]|uniref:VirD4-like conjugal transfer protein, CD1115 family n=1 Tax=Thermoactinomyces sp. DSM 45891 TaxID=1761907 RepID=UPI0009159098|nr:type IV secretory system conjugative DNA transfer family protein [Thermoactinomyces sp. DSM 45891]SFX74525.1 Type IV secretory system Conjugative DNA transfer [Thermoactinomyces sp. DSM 45891]